MVPLAMTEMSKIGHNVIAVLGGLHSMGQMSGQKTCLGVLNPEMLDITSFGINC